MKSLDNGFGDMLDQARRQLTAFNDLCQMLSAADTLDSLVQILVEYLQKAIPNAQRGAVLLPGAGGSFHKYDLD